MATYLEKSSKAQWGEQALTPVSNPVILVKIGSLGCYLPGLQSRPLKKERKNIGDIYSHSGTFAERSKSSQI